MILTTTNTIEHHKIVDYLGIVTGVSIKPRDKVKAKLTINYDDYSQVMEKAIDELKETAFQELRKNAKNLDANAVIGIQVDFESVGGTGMFFGVSVSGTAVKVA